jgi:hypothetical protein
MSREVNFKFFIGDKEVSHSSIDWEAYTTSKAIGDIIYLVKREPSKGGFLSTRHKADPYNITTTGYHPPSQNVLNNYRDTVKKGYKESEGKLSFELDWDFLKQMAERMSKNKAKYEPYNWKKPMDVVELKQSLFRHVLEVMEGNYKDDDRVLGHIEAIALNAMMINYQLKNK